MPSDDPRRDLPGPAHSGGVHIGSVHGAFAVGNDNTVTNYAAPQQPARDPAQEELLNAVRELRADLQRLTPAPETDALGAELADVQDEIERTGSASPGRLQRLRTALADAGAVTGLLASGAAVVQSVTGLLGG
ncbi:hypothetical protein AB0I82_29545 [Streptomyces sp. NPDC050315]|uniref:hypothetical protein n=1 Tax=Streptomyces sp. NPDC050315 TaxID=3155039 RepID=UPI00341BCC55